MPPPPPVAGHGKQAPQLRNLLSQPQQRARSFGGQRRQLGGQRGVPATAVAQRQPPGVGALRRGIGRQRILYGDACQAAAARAAARVRVVAEPHGWRAGATTTTACHRHGCRAAGVLYGAWVRGWEMRAICLGGPALTFSIRARPRPLHGRFASRNHRFSRDYNGDNSSQLGLLPCVEMAAGRPTTCTRNKHTHALYGHPPP